MSQGLCKVPAPFLYGEQSVTATDLVPLEKTLVLNCGQCQVRITVREEPDGTLCYRVVDEPCKNFCMMQLERLLFEGEMTTH